MNIYRVVSDTNPDFSQEFNAGTVLTLHAMGILEPLEDTKDDSINVRWFKKSA